MSSPASHNHWRTIALRWAEIGAPLRPVAEDLKFVADEASGWAKQQGRAPRVLILGVTPELCGLDWPKGTSVCAVDQSPDMIRAVWPGDPAQVTSANWLDVGSVHAPGSFDIVVCDGGLHLLPYPDGQSRLSEVVAKLLAPRGLVIVRLFALPKVSESIAQVLAALANGKVTDMNRLKLRVGMALQKDSTTGACLGDVWNCIAAVEPDLAALARRLGWRREHAEALVSYRESSSRYYFSTSQAAIDCLESSGQLRCVRTHLPSYADAEQFPTVVWERL
ncbi:MAG TPA: hypothetical protein DCY41_03005 [Opitutae bacterium]|nr:hypothetical protein [Opitutae bacterium]